MATTELVLAAGRTWPRTWRAYLALFVGMLCISSTAIFTKMAGVPGPAAAAIRMIVAALVLTVPFVAQSRRRPALPRAGVRLACMGGIWFAINLAMLNSALLLTSAATATILDNTAPLWVGAGALLVFRERLRGTYWVSLLLALGGAAVVTGVSRVQAQPLNPGNLIAFAGAIFYAGYLLTTQRARENVDTVSYLWLIEVSAALALVVITFVMRIPLTGYPLHSYVALIAVALVAQTGGWLLINYALGYLPASIAVVVLLAQPIVTSLLSIPVLHESLSLDQLAGGALVLSGIYLSISARGD